MNSNQYNKIQALYHLMYHKLIVYAESCLDSEGLAEEAVQETFRIACQKPNELCSSANPQGWIFNTLKNTIRNICAKQKSDREILENYKHIYAEHICLAENDCSVELLYNNLSQTKEFQLLKEIAVDGKTYAEIAEKQGITIASCRKRVQRAREYLQKKYKK